MANKPADRNAEAIEDAVTIMNAIAVIQHFKNVRKNIVRAGEPKPDKMHLYVNGRHKLSVDADKAHAVAETYMRQGDSVWLSRKAVTTRA